MKRPDGISQRLPYTMRLLFGVVLLSFVIGGAVFYREQERHQRIDEEQKLLAIAQLKVNEITRWRQERLGDGAVAVSGSFLSSAIERWAQTFDPVLATQIIERLEAYRHSYHYISVFIVDVDGKIQLSSGTAEKQISSETARYLQIAIQEQRSLFSDLYICSTHHATHLDIIAPFTTHTATSEKAFGALILRIDPNEFLFPLIQSWPMPSTTAETLIVRRDGEDALFLNELRHQKGTALNLRIPLTRTDVPAVMAIQGKEGIVEGIDYRGAPVLSVLKHIPDSSWYMITKIDTAEAFSVWRFRATIIIVGTLLLLGLTLAIMGFFWYRQQKEHYRSLYRTEKTLRENEAKYRTIVESTNDAVYIHDFKGNIIDVNEQACNMLGYKREELVGANLQKIDTQELSKVMPEQIRKLLIKGSSYFEGAQTRKDGTVIFVDVGSRVISQEGDGVIIGFVRDVTERKRAEEALKKNEALLRTLINTIPDLVWLKDPEGVYLACNQRFEFLFGAKESDIAGKSDHDFMDKEQADFFRMNDQKAIAAGKPTMNEERVTFANDGHQEILETIKTPIYGKDGVLVGVLGIGRDITARKQSEKELRLNEARLGKSQQVGHVASWEFDLQTGKIWGSDEGFRIYGLPIPADNLLPIDRIEECIPERKRVHQALIDLIEKNIPYNLEFAINPADESSQRIITSVAELIRDDKGCPLKVVGAIQDITDIKRSEETLRLSEEKFNKAFHASPDTLIITRAADGRIVEVNEEFSRMSGYTREEALNSSTIALDLWADPKERDLVVAALREGGGVRDREVAFRAKDGHLIDCLYAGEIIRLHGSPHVISIVRDITDRKRAEEALRLAHEDWENTFNTITDMVTVHDADFNIIRANKAAREIFGISSLEELSLGTKCFHCYHGTEKPPTACPSCDCLKTGDPALCEVFEPHLNKHLEIRAIPRMGDGRIVGLVHVVRDITDRKQAEAALQESASRFDQLAEQSRTIAWEVDSHGLYTYVSRMAEVVLGYTTDELVGRRHFYDLHPEEGREAFKTAAFAVFARKELFQGLINPVQTKDGRLVWVSTNGIPLLNMDGSLRGYRGSDTDITDRQRAEEVLQAERDRAQKYLDIAGTVLVSIASDQTITLINKKGCELLGYVPEELIGKNWFDIAVLQHQREQLKNAFSRIICGDIAGLEFYENFVVTRNGEERLVAWHNVLLRDQTGVVIGTLSSGEDITERKALELNREDLMTSLQNKNEEMESILYASSHDLRSPLVNIQGFSDRIRRYLAELDRIFNMKVPAHEMCEAAVPIIRNNIPRALGYVTASTDKMDALVNGLLKLSRLGRATHTPGSIDMNELMRETLDALKFQTQEARAVVTREELPSCWGDRREIGQAFSNLVDNALKYRDPARPLAVRIAGTVMGDRVTYTVADTGIGIKKGYQDQIWGLFSRLDPSGPIAGEGIGLTMVKRIVQRNRGKIWMESEPGKGSIFYIVLPHDRMGAVQKETAPHT